MVLLSTDNTYQWADGVYLLIIPIIGLMVLLSTDNNYHWSDGVIIY